MKHLFALLLCSALAVSTVSAQDAAYRFEKDKEYTYLIEQTSMQMQELPGQTITVNGELTMKATYTLLEKMDSGNLKLKATIVSALMINETPNGTQTFGGDMAGKSAIFEMTGDGQVVDIDSSIREIDSEGVGLLIGATQIFPRLDGSKITDGNSWTTSEADTTGKGEGIIVEETEREYQISGKKTVNGLDCFEIKLSSESDRDGKMINGEQELMVNGTRNGKGTILYAPAAGTIVSFDAEMNLDQIIVLTANNTRIPVTATQNAKVELVAN